MTLTSRGTRSLLLFVPIGASSRVKLCCCDLHMNHRKTELPFMMPRSGIHKSGVVGAPASIPCACTTLIRKWRIHLYSSPLTLLRRTRSPMAVVSYPNLLHPHSTPFLFPPHTKNRSGSQNTMTSQHLHRPSRAQARRKA